MQPHSTILRRPQIISIPLPQQRRKRLLRAAPWTQSRAHYEDLEDFTHHLVLVMHNLHSVLARKKAERQSRLVSIVGAHQIQIFARPRDTTLALPLPRQRIKLIAQDIQIRGAVMARRVVCGANEVKGTAVVKIHLPTLWDTPPNITPLCIKDLTRAIG